MSTHEEIKGAVIKLCESLKLLTQIEAKSSSNVLKAIPEDNAGARCQFKMDEFMGLLVLERCSALCDEIANLITGGDY